jgi:hypothetical protein
MVPPPHENRKALLDNGIGDDAPTNGHRPVNYRELAPVYVRQGYPAPIPLPQGRKSPPPNGYTGRHNTLPPTAEQIEEWREKRGDDGIAVVAQDGELWIDVDNYAKGDWPAGTGVATMADAQELAGCDLPLGPKLRNRTDGSEKRPFRVPQGLKFKKSLGPCVDVVTPTHRYVNAGINPDTGNPERWFDADDNPLDEPPPPEAWPELPEAWVRLLIRDYSEGLGEASFATEQQAQAWLDDMPAGTMGCLVREVLNCALDGLDGRWGSRHDHTQEQVRWVVEIGAAGLSGARAALALLREQFVDAVKGDRDGGEREATDEFDGFVDWGARVCRPDVFYALKALEHTGYDGWAQNLINGPASDERLTRSLADLTPTKVKWVWRGWLPLGKVTILEGEPEEGKSVITLAWTAIVTQGREWPLTTIDDEPLPRDKTDPAGAVLVGIEDDLEDTVVPRLDAAGADRSRIHIVNQPLDDKGNPKAFLIPDDVDRLRMAILETGAKLVVIDPITAFLSTKQAKAGDDPSTRQALMPLVILAAETGCAIVLVRHLNKATGMSAKHRGSGTIAYTGIARSVIVAGELKEPKQNGPTHALALTKGNLTKRPKAIGYRLDSAPSDPENPVVNWFGPLDLTADQILGADGAKVGDARKSAPVRDECERVLRELLADGPMPMKDAIKQTRDAVGCGAGSVHDAAKRLYVVKKPVRVESKIDHWTWELPPTKIRLINDKGGDSELEDPNP